MCATHYVSPKLEVCPAESRQVRAGRVRRLVLDRLGLEPDLVEVQPFEPIGRVVVGPEEHRAETPDALAIELVPFLVGGEGRVRLRPGAGDSRRFEFDPGWHASGRARRGSRRQSARARASRRRDR